MKFQTVISTYNSCGLLTQSKKTLLDKAVQALDKKQGMNRPLDQEFQDIRNSTLVWSKTTHKYQRLE